MPTSTAGSPRAIISRCDAIVRALRVVSRSMRSTGTFGKRLSDALLAALRADTDAAQIRLAAIRTARQQRRREAAMVAAQSARATDAASAGSRSAGTRRTNRSACTDRTGE